MSTPANGDTPPSQPQPTGPTGRIVIDYDDTTGNINYRVDGVIPPATLLMILEMAKFNIIQHQIGQTRSSPRRAPGIIIPGGPMPPHPHG